MKEYEKGKLEIEQEQLFKAFCIGNTYLWIFDA